MTGSDEEDDREQTEGGLVRHVTPNGARVGSKWVTLNRHQVDIIQETVKLTLFDKVKCCKKADLTFGSVAIGIVLETLNLNMGAMPDLQKKEICAVTTQKMNCLKNGSRRSLTSSLSKFMEAIPCYV
jgi:hypothetical protein